MSFYVVNMFNDFARASLCCSLGVMEVAVALLGCSLGLVHGVVSGFLCVLSCF